jgi:spermidine/putrescine transport system permease protein
MAHPQRKQLLLLVPALAVLLVFMVLPMGLVGIMSFLEPDTFGGVRWGEWTVDSYVKFLFDRDLMDELVLNTDYLAIFVRSFVLAVLAVVITLAIGLPVALYIALQEPRRRNLLLLLVTIPFWVNLLVRSYAWILLLRNGGLVEQGLTALGFGLDGLNVLYTPLAVAIGLVYAYLPFMVLPIYASLEKMDWRLVEAAFDLGARRWQAIRLIVLPLAMPGIVAGCLLVFVPALGTYYIPELLGGGKQLMIGSLIQVQFGSARNWPFGAALAFTLLALVLLGLLFYTLRFKKGLDQ